MSDLKQTYLNLEPAGNLLSEKMGEFYVPRPHHPIGVLAEELLIRPNPLYALLAGQRGVGKTTDLCWLATALRARNPGQPVFQIQFPFQQDFWEGLVRAVLAGKPEGLPNLLAGYDPTPENVAFRLEKTSRLPSRNTPLTSPVFANALLDALGAPGLPGVVLIDGGERLDAMTCVGLIDKLSELRHSVVLTAPITAILDDRFFTSAQKWNRRIELPAVQVIDGAGRLGDGAEYMRMVIARRADPGAFTPEALDLLIPAGAGIHRELVGLCQQASAQAMSRNRERITDADARAAIEQRRQNLGTLLSLEDLQVLDQVRHTEAFVRDERTTRLLEGNYIVYYHGDRPQYKPHPLLLPRLQLLIRAG